MVCPAEQGVTWVRLWGQKPHSASTPLAEPQPVPWAPTMPGTRECSQALNKGVAQLSPQKYQRQKGPSLLWLLEHLFQGSRSVLSSFLLRAQKRPVGLRGAMMMGASGGVRMGVVSDVVSSASLSTSSKLSLTDGMICTTFS